MNGLRIAPIIRRVICAGSIFSLECTLATRTWRRPSISSVWSRPPSSRMSTSMPLSRVKEPPRWSLTASTTSSWRARRSALRPWATVRRGEWSVSTRYSWPSSTAVNAISSMGEPPSDQSEWECRSPRSAARSSRPPGASGPTLAASSFASRSGTSPRTAAAITFPELAPMPGRSVRRSSATSRATSSAGSGRIAAAALRKACTLKVSSRPRSSRKAIRRSAATGPSTAAVLAHAPIMPKRGADERRGSARPRDTCLPLASVERRGPEPRRGRR